MDPRSYKVIIIAIKAIFVAVIFASIISVAINYRNELTLQVSINWSILTFGMICCLVYRVMNANGWSLLLKAIGQPMPTLIAIKVWVISEACRWLPGHLWNYGSRIYQSKQYGVKSASVAASLFLELILTIAAWFSVATIGLVVYRDAFAKQYDLLSINTIMAMSLAAVSASALLMFTRKALFSKFSAKYENLRDRFLSLTHMRISIPFLLGVFAYYLLMCFFNGVAFYFVLQGVVPNSTVPLLAAIGANAVAWLIGFFTFLAPGGLVVREGSLAAILVVWMPIEQALTVAIVWRIVQIAVELICIAGACLPSTGKSRQKEFAN